MFLVIILSVILGYVYFSTFFDFISAANAYLGLFAGITFSVSIPSAILAMALLRPFKSNILEINAVQTGKNLNHISIIITNLRKCRRIKSCIWNYLYNSSTYHAWLLGRNPLFRDHSHRRSRRNSRSKGLFCGPTNNS